MKPSIGRIVHYVHLKGGLCIASIITAVHDDHDVTLAAFPQHAAPAPVERVTFDDDDLPGERKGGSWHWPERVE